VTGDRDDEAAARIEEAKAAIRDGVERAKELISEARQQIRPAAPVAPGQPADAGEPPQTRPEPRPRAAPRPDLRRLR